MFPPVRTSDPAAVAAEVQAACLEMFPDADPEFVPQIFGWLTECFSGKWRDYQAVDAAYHDFEHTLQGTLCLALLLRGRWRAGARPELSAEMVRLGLLSILLHDTGYLKTRGDVHGTGAKYTITHVDRSADFAARLLREKGFSPPQILAVQNMIRCTGIDAHLPAIPFQSEPEKILGLALATADLLGQMAADNYVEKLPVLYAEFQEAVRFTGNKDHFVARFTSSADLIEKTPGFWETFVRTRLDDELGGLYRFLNDPYPSGPNPYVERILANLQRVRTRAV